jgi:hypothetical protein
VRQALPLVLLFAAAAAGETLPTDGRTSFTRDPDIVIPFDIKDTSKVSKVILYSNFDGGQWQEADSITAGGRRKFQFRADREGPYGFATLTEFRDGTTSPPNRDQLVEQKRVVYDRSPPRIAVFRAATSADGDPGVEWDVVEENLGNRGIQIEFRWSDERDFRSIDRDVPFRGRDSRFWKLKPRQAMAVRLVATDRAGNKAVSDPIWVGDKDGAADAPPIRATAIGSSAAGAGAGAVRDPAVARAGGTVQPSLHYLNTKKVKLSMNALVGPSGLESATLWVADEKLVWKKADEKEKLPAPPAVNPEEKRKLPIDFSYETPGDGLYNFVIVVRTHKHQSRPDPRVGEAGDFQVMVDTTKPKVDITSTTVSRAGERGAMVDVRWKAEDKNIAPLPIKIEYQPIKPEGGGGEWKAITQDWVDNTGQHTWTVPTGEAYLFKLKVTCRDRAGNTQEVITPNPVNTDLSVPGVDGVDVKPGDGKPGMADLKVGPG